MLAPDEGHGFARPVNNMAMFMASEKFLAKHLDGRYQQGATPEVTKRLAELMVDPKTVALSKKVDAGSVGVPKPAVDLKAGTWKYEAKIAMGPQQLALKTTTAIKEVNGTWVITESMESPMGSATDVTTLDKGTLILRKRSVQQGPVSVELDFANNKAVGKMGMGGQDRPIDTELGGALFADGGGAYNAIGALPLTEGYSTTFRNFDVQKAKPALKQLTVAGSESVTVAGTKYDCFKVDITSADGGADKTTVWITKDTRIPVKLSAVLASMGGATMTADLVP